MRHSHRFPTRIIIPDSFGSPYISVCIFPFTIKVDLLPWRFRLLCFYHTAKEADTKSKYERLVPVVGRLKKDMLLFDGRTVLDEGEMQEIVCACTEYFEGIDR